MKPIKLTNFFALIISCFISACYPANQGPPQIATTTLTPPAQAILQSATPQLPTPATTQAASPTPTATVSAPTATTSPTVTPIAPTPSTSASINHIALVESDLIWGLAWSPGGKILAVANARKIWLYDVTNPSAAPRALQSDNGLIHDIAFSPDGTILAAAAQSDDLYLWDMATETGVAILPDPTITNRNSLAFSPDGATLAVGNSISNGGFVQFIDPHSHTEQSVIDMHAWLSDVTLSNDYLAVVSGGRQHSGMSLLNRQTGERLEMDRRCDLFFPASVTSAGSLAFSPDGNLFAFGITAGNYSGTTSAVEVWDLKAGVCRGVLPRFRHGSDYLAFSPDGALLATTDNASIRLWNPHTLTKVMEIYPQASGMPYFTLRGFEPFVFSPDGARLAYVDGSTIQFLTLPPDLATNPDPSAFQPELLTIDNLAAHSQDQLQTSYQINDAGGVNQASLRLVEREGLAMMALDYVINQSSPNNYVMAERCFVPEQDWQNANFLEIAVENDDQPKTLIVQFGEGPRCGTEPFNGEVWRTQIRLPAGAKTTLNLPLNDSLFFGRTSWSPQQNGHFDLAKIGYFAVGFEAGPSQGTFYIGTARLWP